MHGQQNIQKKKFEDVAIMTCTKALDKLHILWTVYGDTYTWERPRRCTFVPVVSC